MEGQIELEDYLRSLNCEGFDICDYIPEGRANAVTRYELCMKTGFRDRQVRDLIHYARRDGSILNLSDGKGYFRPDLDDPVERGMLAAYVRQEESRRDSIDWSLNGAIKDCKEKLTVKEQLLSPRNCWKYKDAAAATSVTYGMDVKNWSKWDGESEIASTAGHHITLVECDQNYKAVRSGDVAVTVNPGA